MRLNPEFFKDPDPEPDVSADIDEVLKEGFKVINTLDDLPQNKIDELDQLSERVSEMLEHEDVVNPGKNAMIRYMAFQELQIHGLQQALANVHAMLLLMAKTLDDKEDKKDGNA
jgi:hypothetical protein